MALPGNHTLDIEEIRVACSSVGATPVTVYVHIPYRGRVMAFSGVLGGAITTADATITVTNITTSTVIGTFTMTQSGSAAGLLFTGSPTTLANSYCAQDDVISIAPTGASGASIPAYFRLAYRKG